MNLSTNSIIALSVALGFFFIILPVSFFLINTFSSPKNPEFIDAGPDSGYWDSPSRNSFSGQYADDAALSGIGGRKRNLRHKTQKPKSKVKKHLKRK
jgi:hypothetical protein